MSQWYLFLMAIGSLVLAMSPLAANSNLTFVMGIVLIVIGGILYLRRKKS
ncbi:MAG: LPXTG cell wall anchor domain-containing protein [Atopostipes sp.]|nr:LPXTG cell wall anchor domain-containing protein [Atopostipes sp.]